MAQLVHRIACLVQITQGAGKTSPHQANGPMGRCFFIATGPTFFFPCPFLEDRPDQGSDKENAMLITLQSVLRI